MGTQRIQEIQITQIRRRLHPDLHIMIYNTFGLEILLCRSNTTYSSRRANKGRPLRRFSLPLKADPLEHASRIGQSADVMVLFSFELAPQSPHPIRTPNNTIQSGLMQSEGTRQCHCCSRLCRHCNASIVIAVSGGSSLSPTGFVLRLANRNVGRMLVLTSGGSSLLPLVEQRSAHC